MLYISLATLLVLICIVLFGLGRLSDTFNQLGQALFFALVVTFVATLMIGLYGNEATIIAGGEFLTN